MPKSNKRADGRRVFVEKTNIRRIRKWKKRKNFAPYLFLVLVIALGIFMAIYVSRNR